MVRVVTNDPTHHWPLLAQGGLPRNTNKIKKYHEKKGETWTLSSNPEIRQRNIAIHVKISITKRNNYLAKIRCNR